MGDWLQLKDGFGGVPVSTGRAIPTQEFGLGHAIDRIKGDYGDTVLIKPKALRKWGQNTAVGTSRATVMTLAGSETAETLLTTDTAISMSSSSGSDTAQTLTVLEGHTSSAGNLTFANGSGAFADAIGTTLTGQTAAALGISTTRLTRARLSAPATGNIYFYETGTSLSSGVPSDATKVHMMIPAGEIQTQKASTAVSSQDYYIITAMTCGSLDKTASFIQARLEIKAWNGAASQDWYPIMQWIPGGSATLTEVDFSTPLIVPKNHDVRISAIADGANTNVVAGMAGYLALVQ